jgi:hypothetical protein
MGRSALGKQVKLPVQIVLVASDCHESLAGVGALSKKSLLLMGTRRAATPRELVQLHFIFLPNEVSFLRKEVLFRDFEHLGKELNLLVGGGTTKGLDIGEDFSGHIDVTDQVQFGDEFGL